MNDPSKGYLKIESESCFFPKKAVIILAMTVFPKRLGRVMHIWVLPESKNGNNLNILMRQSRLSSLD